MIFIKRIPSNKLIILVKRNSNDDNKTIIRINKYKIYAKNNFIYINNHKY